MTEHLTPKHDDLWRRIRDASGRIDAHPRTASEEDYRLIRCRTFDGHTLSIDVDLAIEYGFLTEADR